MFNKKIYIAAIITIVVVIALLPVLNMVKNQICSSMMLEAIEEDDVSKLERLLVIGNPDYVPGNAFFDVFCERVDKRTPLQLACYEGKIDMVKLLVEKGADVNCVKRNAVSAPLTSTIRGNSEENTKIVKYLIDQGADVNYESPNGMRALDWIIDKRTVSENDIEIIKILMNSGIDKELRHLTKACFWKHNNIIKYLIEECDYPTEGGAVIQQYCRGVNNFSIQIFELLIQNGADIYELDKDGKCAVDYLLETTDGDTYWVDVMKSLYKK